MSEYTLEDGRKAEKVENKIDSVTKVTEVYVEPKPEKKLSQRITERLCVCEREIETLDEVTGEVISRVVEKVCDQSSEEKTVSKSALQLVVEDKINKGFGLKNYVFVSVIVLQLLALAYVVFMM
jgi:hypothetical protein